MFHKEGHKIIIIATTIVVAGILLIDTLVTLPWLKMLLEITFLIFFVLILQFFRNPKRNTVVNDNQVLSPVDGKVVVIEEVEETEYFNEKRIQVSVFMSPF
jgi:phosphatidylserine decarboxylase